MIFSVIILQITVTTRLCSALVNSSSKILYLDFHQAVTPPPCGWCQRGGPPPPNDATEIKMKRNLVIREIDVIRFSFI